LAFVEKNQKQSVRQSIDINWFGMWRVGELPRTGRKSKIRQIIYQNVCYLYVDFIPDSGRLEQSTNATYISSKPIPCMAIT
jgi:hypothetical protein